MAAGLSHQLAYAKAQGAEREHILLFEDDCVPCLSGNQFHQVLRQALAALPSDFLILQLGVMTAGKAPLTCRRKVSDLDHGAMVAHSSSLT